MQNRSFRGLISKPFIAALAALRGHPTILFISVALLIPNAVFLIAILAGIGTPQRFAAIVAYLVVALVARHAPAVVVVTSYLVVLVYDLASTVALLFGLSLIEMVSVLRFVFEVKLFASPLYALIGVGITASTVFALILLVRERVYLQRAHLAVPLVGAAALVVLDVTVNSMAHYHFGTAFAAGQPFASAVKGSGLESHLNGQGAPRTVLVVMVEGLGVFDKNSHQNLIEAPLMSPELQARYDVQRGQTAYYGSTTAAEMRELCATRSPYQTVMESPQLTCLPARMAAQGYRTVAVHGFSERMFQRAQWYPNIGFEKSLFARDLSQHGQAECGAVFKGACDVAIVDRLAAIIDASEQPLFLYWLTLNTHIPIAPAEHSGNVPCQDGGAFGDGEVCDMAGMWFDLFTGVAGLALKTDMDILIVGDHAPPLWSRKQRALFKPGVVPWLLLSQKPKKS